MTNLLDERIDYHQNIDRTYRHGVVRTLFHPDAIPRYPRYHRLIDLRECVRSNLEIETGLVKSKILQRSSQQEDDGCFLVALNYQ